MIQVCVFNPALDFMETCPNLSVRLSDALRTGTVKDVGVASEPNGIDDVDAVGSRVEDAFDAFNALHGVQNDKSGVYVNQSSESSKVVIE